MKIDSSDPEGTSLSEAHRNINQWWSANATIRRFSIHRKFIIFQRVSRTVLARTTVRFWKYSVFTSHHNHPIHTHRARFDRDEMVFGDFTGGGGGLDNRDNNQRDEASRIQALRTANCIKILGKGVIRVVHRVDDARENNALGEWHKTRI